MKNFFITAGIVGVTIAGIIYYLQNSMTGRKQVINVEDGFPVNA
jgi:hypothetical protein